METPKKPNFFNEMYSLFGKYNQRSVQEYLVDSSESAASPNITPMCWHDGPFIDDVVQSDIGDCWLIASIQSLLETGKGGKENIKRIFKYIVNEKVNGEQKPKWVVLQLYPIKLYVEYRDIKNKSGDKTTLFKIISVPDPKPVDIHINITEEKIIKELGEKRYKFKETANWVKFIEMAFKKFYRDKYITFVGDGWEGNEHGANYIYRHLNDALMNLKKSKETGGNINYGYPLVGQSVLSGEKMETTWMDVVMGYGESTDKAKPITNVNKKNENQIKSTKGEMNLLERKKNIIATLNKLKRYAYCRTINGDKHRYVWDGTDSETDKAQRRKKNIDTFTNGMIDQDDPTNEETKKWNKLITHGRKSGKNTAPRPCAFLRTPGGSSHVMRLEDMTCRKKPNETLAVSDATNVKLYFASTYKPNGGGDGYSGSLQEILERDPTFTIVAEGGEKAKNHSVEKSKKRSYNRLVRLTNEWDGSGEMKNKIKNNEEFTLSKENFPKERKKSTPKVKKSHDIKKK